MSKENEKQKSNTESLGESEWERLYRELWKLKLERIIHSQQLQEKKISPSAAPRQT